MKTKIVSKLPGINSLRKHMYFIYGKIDACEGDINIPIEFWCDSCKRLLKKIVSLRQKIEDVELETLQSKAYKEMHKAELRADQAYSRPTPSYTYRCSQCGRTWVEGKRLGIYQDLNEDVERCSDCDGIIEKIKPSRK